MANSRDPNQTPQNAASDLGFYCFLKSVCPNIKDYYGIYYWHNQSERDFYCILWHNHISHPFNPAFRVCCCFSLIHFKKDNHLSSTKIPGCWGITCACSVRTRCPCRTTSDRCRSFGQLYVWSTFHRTLVYRWVTWHHRNSTYSFPSHVQFLFKLHFLSVPCAPVFFEN